MEELNFLSTLRISRAVNSFPLSVWKIAGYPMNPNNLDNSKATNDARFLGRLVMYVSPVE
jgi:hypothetical protein